MANKKPLVVNSQGEVAVMQSGDLIDPACLGTGIKDGTTFLAGDGTYKTPSGGGSSSPASNIYMAANFI